MVSIITPAYNAEKYIRFTIESVLIQTYQDWEMLIVDDLSTDKTVAIISEYVTKDNRIKLIEPNKKLYTTGARNIAIELAKGKYIALLDADDIWHKEKLTQQINYMKNGNYYFSYTNYEKIDANGNLISKVIKAPISVTYDKLLRGNPIGCLTVIYDAEKIGKRYAPQNYIDDYLMWLSVMREGTIGYGLNESLAYYRVLKNSKSHRKTKQIVAVWYVYRKHLHFNVFKSAYYFLFYIIEGLRKVYA